MPYKDFQEQVEYQTEIVEMVSGSSVSSDQQQKQIRDAAWQHFVDQNLFLPQAKDAGFEIGKDEMKDLMSGGMVSPVVAYDPIFGDPNGNFDKTKLTAFLDNMASDESGRLRKYWNYVQEAVATQQYYAKYGSLFAASSMPNSLSVQNAIEENNTTASVKAIMVPYSYEKDSTIVVSSSDIKAYYNAHKDFFKQQANRDIKYASFEVVPSSDDITAARKAIDEVYEEFNTTDNMKNFIMRNSEAPYSQLWLAKGDLFELSSVLDDFIFSNKAGASEVFQSGDVFYSVKSLDKKMIPDSVYVRHILIQNNNHLADSLFGVVSANRNQFAAVAARYSADQNPNAISGEIGWLTQTYMIPGMESVLTATVNKPYIIDTRYGRHIVEVTKMTKPVEKHQVAVLKKSAVPSKATMNAAYAKANSLATAAAGKLENLEKAAEEQGVYLREINVTEATASYGAADRAKEVTRWVFEAKKGQVSNVITVNQNHLFVVGVKNIHKEGYATVEESKARIETILYNKARAEKALAEVAAKVEGCTTIEQAEEALGKTAFTSENVTFSSLTSRDNEPAFLGAVAGAEQGKLAGPVKGSMGIYLVQVNDRNVGSFYTEDDASSEQMRRTQYSAQMLIPAMLKGSDSVDNRERFY